MSCSVSEPFHGDVWLGFSRQVAASVVRLVVSVKASWDVDVLLEVGDAAMLADAIGGTQLCIVKGKTSDGDTAVVVVESNRLAITIPRQRFSDIMILGEQAKAIRECLSAATA
jgi:hypothetical protein